MIYIFNYNYVPYRTYKELFINITTPLVLGLIGLGDFKGYIDKMRGMYGIPPLF